ncbi:MAG TPA: diiron oxygenase [Acidimicrobiales bacterium]
MATTFTSDETAPEEPTPTEADEPTLTDDAFERLVGRLNQQSVDKHFDAYVDVPWDELPVDRTDPRWQLGELDPLGATEWYQSQPPEVRSAIGLHLVAAKAKTGLVFEQILQRGLLDFAGGLPNNTPEFRYVVHEVIEEGHHTLMFQELVNRSGFDVPGLGGFDAVGARIVTMLARPFPALFLMFVLGGEDPIDHVQREALKRGDAHPLLERIMRIHVTEEARHLSFARHWLKQNVPGLGRLRRTILAHATPIILGTMSQMMLRPSRHVVETHGIPKQVVKAVYGTPEAQARQAQAVRKVRKLCRELGLMAPTAARIWKAYGIYADDSSTATTA